nr:unnamed protein product [Callosobruchus analis]
MANGQQLEPIITIFCHLSTYFHLSSLSGSCCKRSCCSNCWAFLDGTIRPISRPSVDQQLYYSGHKRTHCLKYQSLVTPDGLTISCMEPFEGRRHDAGILRESGLYGQLEDTTVFPDAHFVIYGDQAYGIRELILCPFPGLNLNPAQEMFNNSMSTVREAVEWIFGKVVAEFAFVDFKKIKNFYFTTYNPCTKLQHFLQIVILAFMAIKVANVLT